MLRLSLQDAKDLLEGCTILGTGGGGKLEHGVALAEEDYAAGRTYCLQTKDEVADDALYTSPYFCGSIGDEDRSKDPYEVYPRIGELETVLAVGALERFLRRPVDGLVSIEYGGGNTAVALSTAARLGKLVADADAAGRAVPDLQFSTFYVAGRDIAPLAVATSIGEVAVVEKVADDFRAEVLVRSLSVVSGGSVGMTDHPLSGTQLRESVIWGALSDAMAVGRTRREALVKGENPVEAILRQADGYLLFTGIVREDTDWANKAGFTVGQTELEGTGAFAGQDFRFWFKNENMICWKNGAVYVTCPDLICIVEQETGFPVLNPNCRKGMRVAALGFRAPEVWRSGKGLSILNPGFFGYDVQWTPIEQIMK